MLCFVTFVTCTKIKHVNQEVISLLMEVLFVGIKPKDWKKNEGGIGSNND